MDLSLIICCYNEAPHLRQSVAEVLAVLRNSRLSFELIFVEDLSTDSTREIVRELEKETPEARAIYHSRNEGHGQSVIDATSIAQGRVVGFIDIDLEVSALYVPTLVDSILSDGFHVATGRRYYAFQPSGNACLRFLLSVGYRQVFRRLLGIPLEDPETGYKFFSREVLTELIRQARNPGWFWDTEVMAAAYLNGYRILEKPCLFRRRADKKTTIRVFHYTLRHFRELLAFRRRLQAREMKRTRRRSEPLSAIRAKELS